MTKDLFLTRFKKRTFSCSHNGMRYMMRSDNGRDSTTFTVFVYPEPWCFEQTPEDQIESHTFDLSEEGLDLAITWLWEPGLKPNVTVGRRHHRK